MVNAGYIEVPESSFLLKMLLYVIQNQCIFKAKMREIQRIFGGIQKKVCDILKILFENFQKDTNQEMK